MSASPSGIAKTVVLFLPLIAIPLVAIFGLPDLSPASASTDEDERTPKSLAPEALRVGDSARYIPHDLFAPYGKAATEPTPSRSPHLRDTEGHTGATGPGTVPGWETDPGSPPDFSEMVPAPAPVTPRSGEMQNWPDRSAQAQPTQPRQPERRAEGTRFPPSPDRSVPAPQPPPISEAWPTDPPSVSPTESVPFGQPEGTPFAETPPPPEFTPAPAPAPTRTATPSVPTTWEQTVARLKELNIRHYELVPGDVPNQYRFTCLYTPPEDPRVSLRFSATAGDALTAVRQVIRQIEARRTQ